MLMVTGASGYLGSAVVGLAVREGRAVRAVVRDPDRAVGVLPAGVEVAVADLADPEALRAAARGCTGVLHVAGSVGGPADDVRRANVDGTRAVLAAAVAAGVPRFVLTSSSAAVIDATGLVAEEPVGPPALTDPYSTSKAAAEELVLAASGRGDIEAVVAAPVSIYGPSPRGPESYNSLFVAAALGTEPVVVDSTVGWILAEDAAAGTCWRWTAGLRGGATCSAGRWPRSAGSCTRSPTWWAAVGWRPCRRARRWDRKAGTFARRSEVYGRFPPVRVADAGARGLGLAPRPVADGIALTADWIGPLAAH
jgi:dihydroflavonol-4-reductase